GRLAEAAVEVRLFQLHNWRTLSRLAKGQDPGPEGSALKLYWSEMSKRLHDTVMAVLGPAAPLWRGAHDHPGDGSWQRSWTYSPARGSTSRPVTTSRSSSRRATSGRSCATRPRGSSGTSRSCTSTAA